MAAPKVIVRYGELGQVYGSPHSWNDISFCAAAVSLKGSSFGYQQFLEDYVKEHKQPHAVRSLLLDGSDAPWVRGRVCLLFPGAVAENAEDRGEKSGLHASFVAVLKQPDGTFLGVPFWCADSYLKTGLMFSEDEDPVPDELVKQIAEAFWSLLLSAPDSLRDYEDKMEHLGAGITMRFGVEDGQPFVVEED